MKKFSGIVCIIGVCLMLVSVTTPAQEQETTSKKEQPGVTICHKGKTITISEEGVDTFLQLGATRGACSEETADSPQQSGQSQKVRETDKKSGQSQKARETDKTSGQEQGKKKVTICHKGKITITIAEAALLAHLRHSDTQGACTGNVQQPQKLSGQSAIFPNNTGTTGKNQTNTQASGNKGTGNNQGKSKNTGKKGGKKGNGKK